MCDVLENALDWLVGGVEINGKPVSVINARPQASLALGALVAGGSAGPA